MSQPLHKADAQTLPEPPPEVPGENPHAVLSLQVAAQLRGIVTLIGERQTAVVTINAREVVPGLECPIAAQLLATAADKLDGASHLPLQEWEAEVREHVLPVVSGATIRLGHQKSLLDAQVSALTEARRQAVEQVPLLEKSIQRIADCLGSFNGMLANSIFRSFETNFLNQLKVDTWDFFPKLGYWDFFQANFSTEHQEKVSEELEKALSQYLRDFVEQWSIQELPKVFQDEVNGLESNIEFCLKDIKFRLNALKHPIVEKIGLQAARSGLDTDSIENVKSSMEASVQRNLAGIIQGNIIGGLGNKLAGLCLITFGLSIIVPLFIRTAASVSIGVIGALIASVVSVAQWRRDKKAAQERFVKNTHSELRKAYAAKASDEIKEAFREVVAKSRVVEEDSEPALGALRAEIQAIPQQLAVILEKKREGKAAVEAEKERLATIGTLLTEHLEVISKKVLTHEEREALLVANTSLTHEG